MKVLKFGGTSVGSVESLRNVRKIVSECSHPVIVVVSALGGITDQLIATARLASEGDLTYLESYAKIVDRHNAIIDALVPPHSLHEVRAIVAPLLDELGNLYKGISLIRDLSDRTLDIVVSYGERLSSVIISFIIDDARHFDSRRFIRTTRQFGKHVLDNEATTHAVLSTFADADFKVAVVPGFISTDLNGDISNLGRGGSDYTAAILAATLDAESLEIWTDVDGFMTADPRVINAAYVIDRLSFTEAMELCNFGAKVIYPPTIYPVYHKNIPIYIKNTFNPSAPGTLISDKSEVVDGRFIKGISSINDTCLITISGLGMVGIVGINARIFNALASHGISVFMVSQASSENNTSFGVRNADADYALTVLREEFAAELAGGQLNYIRAERDLATVAVVGENMKHSTGTAGKLFNTLGRNGINVIALAQGASETNISFVIEKSYLRKALNVIHDSFFLSDNRVLNLFLVGVGNVGRYLLRQIASQQQSLLREKRLELKVVGIANSRRAIFDRDGIDISRYEELLSSASVPSSPALIRDEIIKMNIFNSVFIDCTSSPDIAALYADLLSHNVNVVAANKIAASSDYANYHRLKTIAQRKDVKFLFETNVGAGLPIINTINNLINSGDRILRIEAVLSGTINFIFHVLSPDVPLSLSIRRAMEGGYAEPDPRVDLSGRDVVRKLVILAREAGFMLEQSDVATSLFVPAECFDGSIDDFFRRITALDPEFEKTRLKAERDGRRFRFIARLEAGKASVSLECVGPEHPFYNLAVTNNVIALTTERYRDYPIIIKGYGAGAEVTAAGVFADVISIANIR